MTKTLITNIRGPQGDPGAPGVQGLQGIQGVQGLPGTQGQKGDVAGPAEIAAAQGYWVVYSATPPAQTTMYGVPVVWIDATEVVAPTPVNPPIPTWNDLTSKFTVPTGVVGVDYVWTSGGGGTGGTVTPGVAVSTSGTFPRKVTISPVAKPGYVLVSGIVSFVHDFPDPAADVIRTSDSYASGTSFAGRSTDAALGGTALPYSVLIGSGADVAVSGGLAVHAGAARTLMDIVVTSPIPNDMKLKMDITSLAHGLALTVKGALLSITSGGGVSVFGWSGSQPADNFSVAPASLLGTWQIAVTGATLAVTPPDGVTRFAAIAGTKPTSGNVRIDASAGSGNVSWDNLKIYQVGA